MLYLAVVLALPQSCPWAVVADSQLEQIAEAVSNNPQQQLQHSQGKQYCIH